MLRKSLPPWPRSTLLIYNFYLTRVRTLLSFQPLPLDSHSFLPLTSTSRFSEVLAHIFLSSKSLSFSLCRRFIKVAPVKTSLSRLRTPILLFSLTNRILPVPVLDVIREAHLEAAFQSSYLYSLPSLVILIPSGPRRLLIRVERRSLS